MFSVPWLQLAPRQLKCQEGHVVLRLPKLLLSNSSVLWGQQDRGGRAWHC